MLNGHRKGVGGEGGGVADVIVARHGSTEFNQGGVGKDRLRGQMNLLLDDDGTKQAHDLRDKLASERITYVISSDLRRALDTAQVVAFPHGEPVFGDASLRSWGMGDLEGKRVDPDTIAQIEHYVRNEHEAPPNGESFCQFKGRLVRGINYILRDVYLGDTIVVVTHARCLQLFELWLAAGRDLTTLNEKYVDAMSGEPDTVEPGGYIRLRSTAREPNRGAWSIVERWKESSQVTHPGS